jgi:hypothetical protein
MGASLPKAKPDVLAMIAVVLLIFSAMLWMADRARMDRYTSCLYQQHTTETALEACLKTSP